MKKLHLVINPTAGTRQGRRFLPEIISVFNRAGFLCTVFITEKRGDAVDYTRDETGNADLVVACGGDGTLNEVITGLQLGGYKIPVGYIPCGSTNDFASGLGLPTQPLPTGISVIPPPSEPLPAFPGLRRRMSKMFSAMPPIFSKVSAPWRIFIRSA